MTKPTAAHAAAPLRTSFLDQVEDSTQLAMGAKIQVWGGPETGKSHDAYENLPRPLIVVDSDVSAGLFNDDRFEGFKRLGPDKIPDLETLLAEDSTFYGDLFAHVVKWQGDLYLEDGLHRAVRAALQQRQVLHARVLEMD